MGFLIGQRERGLEGVLGRADRGVVLAREHDRVAGAEELGGDLLLVRGELHRRAGLFLEGVGAVRVFDPEEALHRHADHGGREDPVVVPHFGDEAHDRGREVVGRRVQRQDDPLFGVLAHREPDQNVVGQHQGDSDGGRQQARGCP